MALWQANPHEYGAGKIHVIDEEDPAKTMCGRYLDAVPGKVFTGKPTCKVCMDRVVARPVQRKQSEIYEAQRQQVDAAREFERKQWWAQYNVYLKSEQWRKVRARVLKRAQYRCEGCDECAASQVHHLTYENMGNEFLWELRAVCNACHDRFHAQQDERRAQ